MAPLIFLLATFVILYLLNRFALSGRLTLSFIGRASMAVMLTVTGVVHFTSTDWMVGIMPDFIPAKRELVWFTGVCELAAAVVGLLSDRFSRLTSILLIIFFVLILPANIAESLKPDTGDLEFGKWYLLFRIPLQIFFIWWVWHFGVRRAVSPSTATG